MPSNPATPPNPASPAPAAPRRRWPRRLAIALLGLAGLLAVAATLLHFFFADPLLDFLLARMEARSGLRVRFGSAELSVLRGRCVLTDVRVLRTSHPAGEADFSAKRVELKVGLWSLLRTELSVETLHIDELRGTYERRRASEGRNFVLRDLEVRGATLQLVDRSTAEPHAVDVVLDRLAATDIHRDTLLWDVLLRSNAKGRIGQSEFDASSVRDADGGVSTWTLPRMAAADLLARRLPPNSIDGACSLRVIHRWGGAEPTQARSSWKVGCEGLGLRAGVNAEGVLGAAARWLEKKPRPLALDFHLDVGPDHFSGGGAALARPLLQAAGKGAVEAMLATLAKETLVDAGSRLLETARNWRRNRAAPVAPVAPVAPAPRPVAPTR